MTGRIVLAVVFACALPSAADGTPTVTAGDWVFNTGTTGNIVSILVSGGDAVAGLNGVFTIGDEVSAGQPVITSVDVIGPGTIFGGNNTGQFDAGFPAPGLVVFGNTATAAGTVAAQGILAFLTIDLTGVPCRYAVFEINFHKTVGFPPISLDFNGLPANLVAGSISVCIPEPASMVMGLTALAGLCAVGMRRRRKGAGNPLSALSTNQRNRTGAGSLVDGHLLNDNAPPGEHA